MAAPWHCSGRAWRAWEARDLPEPGVFPYPTGFPPTTGADSPPRSSTKQLLSHPRTLPEPLVSSLNPEGAYVPAGLRECELCWRGCVGSRGRGFCCPKRAAESEQVLGAGGQSYL